MSLKNSKKILVVVILVSFLLPSSLFIQPREARAFVGIGDISFDPSVYAQAIVDTFREEVLNGIAWAVAKALVAQITQQTIAWINSGFDGNPLYIDNLETYYAFICTETFNEFMNELKWEQDISPETKRIIARSLLATRPCDGGRRVTDGRTIAQEVLDDYYQDFRRGGWDVWRRQITNRNNNIYGQYAQSRSELQRRLQTEASNKEQEINWGNGFLTAKQCDADGKSCGNITPGTLIQERLVDIFGSDIEQLNIASNVNQVVNALLARLIEEAFTGAKGVIKKDTSGNTTTSTTGTSDTELLERSRESMVRLIDIYVQNENRYKEIKQESLKALDSASTKLALIAPRTDIDPTVVQQAQEKVEALKISIPLDLASTDTVLARLNDFKTQTRDTGSLSDINNVSKSFSSYKGEAHTGALADAQGEFDTINTIIENINVFIGVEGAE